MADAAKAIILNVGNNEAVRHARSRPLREAGFEVIEAATGGEALERAARESPGVVVLDMELPDMDGVEVCRRIKLDPAASSALVLWIAGPSIREKIRGLEGEADGYLAEPVEPEELIAAVRMLIKTGRAEGELNSLKARIAVEQGEMARQLAREQAARAEAEAANRTKDELLAILSHELRTPTTVILGWARLLRARQFDSDTMARALETIERNAKAQVQLIEGLLDISRIVTGKLRLDFHLVELAPVIQAAIEAARPAADAKAIQLECQLDPQANATLGDPDRLQQVIDNLLSNAIKFTPDGGRVQVRLERAGSHARITVSDTGQGIEADLLPNIFDRLRQAGSTNLRPHGGLGLGLMIARHLVELHGGTIVTESAGAGKGATFTVKLPLAALFLGGTPSSAEVELQFEALPMLKGLRALVVDDEADAREFVSFVLKQREAEVIAVASAVEALEALERVKPDILVSDIGMPGQDGYELIRKVRALGPERGGQIPAVALTARAGLEDRMRLFSAGYQMHVPKPIEPAELLSVIVSLVGRSSQPSL